MYVPRSATLEIAVYLPPSHNVFAEALIKKYFNVIF